MSKNLLYVVIPGVYDILASGDGNFRMQKSDVDRLAPLYPVLNVCTRVVTIESFRFAGTAFDTLHRTVAARLAELHISDYSPGLAVKR